MADSSWLLEAWTAFMREVNTCMPAKVEAFDADAQTVDVVPQLKIAYPDGEGGYVHKALPKISNVKVAFPRSGSFFVSFPLTKGDFVLLVFSQRSLQAWRDKGQVCEPGDLGMFPLDGAVAIPGVYPEADALGDVSPTDMVLGKDGTPAAQIKITPTQVHLGGGAQFVALANLVKARLDAIQSTVDGHTHTFSAPVVAGAVSGTTAVPSSLIGALADVAAQNVKAT